MTLDADARLLIQRIIRAFEGTVRPAASDIVYPGGLKYFDVEELLIPVMETWIFIGENIEDGDVDTLYFQDVESYREGVRYNAANASEEGLFQTCSAKKPNHFFTFERALDLLMDCSLRRRTKVGDAGTVRLTR